MYYPDTLEGVIKFCESEGQPCDSIRQAEAALREILTYWKPNHPGMNDVLDEIAKIANEALPAGDK